MTDKFYDLVGDIHGYADELEALLLRMGYVPDGKGYKHAERTLIFVGDLIDRGPKQKRVVEIAKSMVHCGDAIALMGNHEFNAISYATPLENGGYARPHTPGNEKHHKEFLDEYPFDSDEYAEVIAFFKTMPLWLELGEFRVVHACWHQPSMQALKPHLNESNCIRDDDFYRLVGQESEPCYSALETVLKGPEITLPEGASFADSDGKVRDRARINWWKLHKGEAHAFAVDKELIKKHDMASQYAEAIRYMYDKDHPVIFFGHYWQREEENESKHETNSACLDWSVAKGGRLRGYRWNGCELREQDWF